GVALGKVVQFLTRSRIDDSHAGQRHVRARGCDLYLVSVAKQNRHSQPERMKLPGRLQRPRLGSFGKNDPFRMPLQIFKQTTDKTHGMSVAEIDANRNSSSPLAGSKVGRNTALVNIDLARPEHVADIARLAALVWRAHYPGII